MLGSCLYGVVRGAGSALSVASCPKELSTLTDAMVEGDARTSCDNGAVAKCPGAPQNHRRSQDIL